MAAQEGLIRLTGKCGDLTFYRLNGEYRVRLKSSLTGKTFWKHKAFARSRQSCKRFADGNCLASEVYRSLPKEKRQYTVFCQLKTAAIHYLKIGLTRQEAFPYLVQHAEQLKFILPARPRKRRERKLFPYAVAVNQHFIAMTSGRYMQMVKKLGEDEMTLLVQQTLFTIPHRVPPVARNIAIA